MNLTDNEIWEEGVYQLETTDVVLGGPGGVSNAQAQQLANRTAYLHSKLGMFGEKVITVTGITTIADSEILNNEITLIPDLTAPTVSATVVLDGAVAMANGAVIRIYCAPVPVKTTNILLQPPPGMTFSERSGNIYRLNELPIYGGESAVFMKQDATLILLQTDSNLFRVGEVVHSYTQPIIPAMIAEGQLVSRSAFPRLWQLVRDQAISEVVPPYITNPGFYRGAFTQGNGSTTFRIPDLRGVFIRGLDRLAGLDVDRNPMIEGTYQTDQLKSHAHGILNGSLSSPNPVDKLNSFDFAYQGASVDADTGFWGGNETRSKNVAYTTYIIY